MTNYSKLRYWKIKHLAEHIGTGIYITQCEFCEIARNKIADLLEAQKPKKPWTPEPKYDKTINREVWGDNHIVPLPGRGGEPDGGRDNWEE